ncbi:MAG TPA: methyltransferase domain-containing protein [Acidimicrobiales bacterium]|nr:methyltransferase domain-containing protein [Acidimicrobiales bacterium]
MATRYIEGHTELADRWLLVQTLATATSRRALLSSLGIGPGMRVLDVGTGFGPSVHELAGAAGARAVGTDLDLGKLAAAEDMRQELAAAGWPAPPGASAFVGGDVHRLPYGDATFDATVVRFLYEYLPDPETATAELARILRPGGVACVIDVDDDLAVTYPPESRALERLRAAFTDMQETAGGDRRIGRRLAGILDAGGFDVTAVLAIPQASYGASSPDDPGRRFLVERFATARDQVVGGGFIDGDEFDELLDVLRHEETPAQTVIEAHVAVVGRRR